MPPPPVPGPVAPPTGGPPAPPGFTSKVLIVAAVAAVLALMVLLQTVFVLVFGAVVLGTALNAAATPLMRRAGLPRRWAVLATVLLLAAVLGLGGWLIGDRLAGELQNLRERLPEALAALRAWLGERVLGRQALEMIGSLRDGGIPWSRLAGAAGLTLGAIGSAALMVVLAVYLALDPPLYENGTVRLFPPRYRSRVRDALRASGDGLSRWLLGQGVSMAFVGVSTAVGLALLGMPLALSLGAIAGVLAFVPFFGPIASGLLAVLIAFTESATQALYVALLVVAIQQVEGNVLMPFVQRWAVALPPLLGLISVMIFGLLFGLMGILFATPLMVVLMILVQRLYIEGLLESPPG